MVEYFVKRFVKLSIKKLLILNKYKNIAIRRFIKKRSYLMWYIKDLDNVSEASIVEHVLNYGNFDDVKKMIKILTIKKVSRIFNEQMKNKRNNYSPQIANYFKLYFKKYA